MGDQVCVFPCVEARGSLSPSPSHILRQVLLLEPGTRRPGLWALSLLSFFSTRLQAHAVSCFLRRVLQTLTQLLATVPEALSHLPSPETSYCGKLQPRFYCFIANCGSVSGPSATGCQLSLQGNKLAAFREGREQEYHLQAALSFDITLI